MHFRLHGPNPFHTVLVHGGPGAAGEMCPVGQALLPHATSLEPFQTATTLAGQIDELADTLRAFADPPITLVGYSWGAWLAALTAASYPDLADKLVLVSSGPFEQKYIAKMVRKRQERFTPQEWVEMEQIKVRMADPNIADKSALFARFGALYAKADAYDPLPETPGKNHASLNPTIYQSVWEEAAALRESGELLERVRSIFCPVVAIHGSEDPHPAEGVCEPLSAVLSDFRFVLLEKCGHTPWNERYAREAFYAALLKELITT